MKPKSRLITIFIILTLLLSTPIAYVYGAASGTSGGTIGVSNGTPSLSNLAFEDVGTTSKDGAYVDVSTEYHIEFTVSDTNTIDDLTTVVIKVWSATASTEGAGDGADHYTFTWTESTDAWTGTGLVGGSCVSPSPHTAGSGNFVAAFQLQSTANHADSLDWDIKITVTDDSAASASDATTLDFGVNYYSAITVTDSTHSWSGLAPGATDQALPGDGDIDVSITSNDSFDIDVKADSTPTSGSNTIAIGQIKQHATTLGSAVSLTGSYVAVGGLQAQTRGSSLAKAFKLWITIPNPQEDGSYTYTLRVQVDEAV